MLLIWAFASKCGCTSLYSKVKRDKVFPSYLALVLNSPRCYEQAQLFTRGATNQDLGLGRMKGIVFALPPLSRQELILRAVDSETRDLMQGVQQARREIDLLREYRTRLIADVVTGKLDVREAAGQLSDQPAPEEDTEDISIEDVVESDVDEVESETIA